MIKKIILFFGLFFLIFNTFGQRFPLPVFTGDSLIIVKKYETKVLVVKDTLWIMKHSQLQNAIAKAKKLELEELKTKELNNKIKNLENISKEKEDLISVVKKDRDYYKKNWNVCDEDLKKTLKKCRRKTFYTKLLAAGIPAAFVVGFLIGK